ncbi:MAG: glycosyl hydrolase family 57 [Planctomycetota bacterium]|nr:glycosyl hydrolase family 57 [Planctomycetota bacterium]
MADMPEMIDGWPNISGEETRVAAATAGTAPVFLAESGIDFANINSAWGIALHMQQPLIPAGGQDLKTATIISNLKQMMDNQGIGDNHNASVFHWCYKRIGEFVPELVGQGKNPRVMLDYSGCLFYGLPQMGLTDVLDSLRGVTCDSRYRRCVEWLGCTWGHAVAPSTPIQDYLLQVKAWQHHFAAIFGFDALSRVKGFSPAEMALPNHPDVAYAFVKTLRDSGFQWVMLQEHSLEREDGGGVDRAYVPNRLVCTNTKGEEASILVLVKTQGSDTKLVAQMQPYYEAKSKGRETLAGKSIPPYVCQIGDGENGGVMMNEFPGMFRQAMGESSGSGTPAMNGTEYLEHVLNQGFKEADFPVVRPKWSKLLFEHFKPGDDITKAIEECKKVDGRFNMEGGSWTNDISWVRGYDNILGPMEKASSLFSEKTKNIPSSDPRYRKALFHLLCSQTSCYRYWGQGIWTDYGAEICRRAIDVLTYDL